MLPLAFTAAGDKSIIKKICGEAGFKQHLGDMGLTVGQEVQTVAATNGSVILCVKGSRIALNNETAAKILV